MIPIYRSDRDDPDFIELVKAIATGVARRSLPRPLIVVKVDSWFGPRWHEFSGKYMGAVGVRRRPLRVPPFVPSRVYWQATHHGATFHREPIRPRLHVWITSELGMRRHFADTADDASALWFSGSTRKNGRGSIMTYALERVEAYAWYAGWIKKDTWLPTQLRRISRGELQFLSAPAASNTIADSREHSLGQ